METYSIISTVISIIMGGGWFIYYGANKRKANGEATQSEADGWARQQEVYHNTIEELKSTCEYIANDRNVLRDENDKLRKENNLLRDKINEMEEQLFEMKKEVSRLGRRIEALSEKSKEKKHDGDDKERK